MRLVGNGEATGAAVAAERDAERRFLTDPRLAACVERADRLSVRYSDLAA